MVSGPVFLFGLTFGTFKMSLDCFEPARAGTADGVGGLQGVLTPGALVSRAGVVEWYWVIT